MALEDGDEVVDEDEGACDADGAPDESADCGSGEEAQVKGEDGQLDCEYLCKVEHFVYIHVLPGLSFADKRGTWDRSSRKESW